VSLQLALNFRLRDDARFENYYAGENPQAIRDLQDLALGLGEKYLYLSGPTGVGLSHLLQAACHLSEQNGWTAVYLPLKKIQSSDIDMLSGLEKIALVCIDDLDCIAGNKVLEEAVFHLFNRIRAEQTCLVIAAHLPSHQLGIKLADLQSRLAWGISYHLHPLTDEQKLEALMLRAKVRGLNLSPQLGQYLLSHFPRDMNKLFALLEKLDKASIEQQRKLTIPFVKEVLGV